MERLRRLGLGLLLAGGLLGAATDASAACAQGTSGICRECQENPFNGNLSCYYTNWSGACYCSVWRGPGYVICDESGGCWA